MKVDGLILIDWQGTLTTYEPELRLSMIETLRKNGWFVAVNTGDPSAVPADVAAAADEVRSKVDAPAELFDGMDWTWVAAVDDDSRYLDALRRSLPKLGPGVERWWWLRPRQLYGLVRIVERGLHVSVEEYGD